MLPEYVPTSLDLSVDYCSHNMKTWTKAPDKVPPHKSTEEMMEDSNNPNKDGPSSSLAINPHKSDA